MNIYELLFPRNKHHRHQCSHFRRIAFSFQLLVFHFIWSLSSIYSLEIWSVYFDNTLELFKKNNNCLVQQLTDVPFDDEKYIIEIQTFIESMESRNQIRRMELSLCDEIIDNDYPNFSNDSLFFDNVNGIAYICIQRLASIELPNIDNQTIVRYPENVAMPFSKISNDNTFQTLLLTIEYTQPYEQFQDHSGFDLYLTEPSDAYTKAGIMAVGFVPDFRFFIPPNLNHWSLKGVCMNSCLNNRNVDEIKIFAIIPNTDHRYLEELSVSIAENGNNQRPAREIYSYTPSSIALQDYYKSVELLEEPIVNMSNDKITVHCQYFTTNRTIKSGFGDDNENCLVWLHYHPKIEMDACLSSYSFATIMSLLDLDDINVTITRARGIDLKIKKQINNEQNNEQNELYNYFDWKDRTRQWNIDKLIRTRYGASRSKQMAHCGWNPMKMEIRR